jgi:uncharacterized protein (TIGR03437 family)
VTSSSDTIQIRSPLKTQYFASASKMPLSATMSKFVCGLLWALPLVAQFENISTTDDGSQIYFSTSLRPRGSDHVSWPKVYRLDGNGIHLVSQASSFPGGNGEPFWMVKSASVSGDGKVVAINSYRECKSGNICRPVLTESTEVRTPTGTWSDRGPAEVSRSGRYVTVNRATGFPVPPPGAPIGNSGQGLYRIDLRTGTETFLGFAPAQSGRRLGDDGTVLMAGWTLVTTAGESVSLGNNDNYFRADLAPDASFVVYQPRTDPSSLRIRDRSGADSLLADQGSFPSISADSKRILYLAPVNGKLQAFLAERGSAAVQVTFEPDGITEATVSGATGLVVAVTGAGQLITVDARNGFRSEYIGKTPKLSPPPLNPFQESQPYYPSQAIGSTYAIEGEGLAVQQAAFESPLPFTAGGIHVLVNGTPAPIYALSPNRVTYQVSWESKPTEPAQRAEVVLRSEDSTFEGVMALNALVVAAPRFMPLGVGDRIGYAVHQDWRGIVHRGDPAKPGEYLHFYATGLGPVSPAVPTGTSSPLSPLAIAPASCQWQQGSWQAQADVPFAGLAPGLVGYYQLTVKVPETFSAFQNEIGLNCVGWGTMIGIPVTGT